MENVIFDIRQLTTEQKKSAEALNEKDQLSRAARDSCACTVNVKEPVREVHTVIAGLPKADIEKADPARAQAPSLAPHVGYASLPPRKRNNLLRMGE